MKRAFCLLILLALMAAPASADKLASPKNDKPPKIASCYENMEFKEEDGPWWVVISNRKGYRLNLRERPDKHADYIAKYLSGTIVRQVEPEEDGWMKVEIGSLTGYVDTEYLQEGLIAENCELKTVTVKNSGGRGANLRTAPSMEDSEVVMTLENGETATAIGVLPDGWIQVIYRSEYYFAKAPLFIPILLTYPDDIASGKTGVYYVYNPNPVDRLNLRRSASTGAEAFARFYGGTPVYVVGFDENLEWAHVHLMELDGWMSTTYLKSARIQTAMPETEIGPTGALLYLEPGEDDSPVYLGGGTDVTVYGLTDDGWAGVEADGMMGWVLLDELDADSGISWSR